jgi:hypothetical protein
MLVRNSDVHARNTRYSTLNMVCPKYIRETEGGRTFTVITIKEWNTLDVPLRSHIHISSFKRGLYNKLLRRDQKNAMRLEIA